MAIGFAGAKLFELLGIPLPWLLGSLFATILASMSGAPVTVTRPIRNGVAVMIGLLVGSTFYPEILDRVHEWVLSLIAAVFYVGIITLAALWYCRKLLRMDKGTALFAALPGGLSEMTLMAEEAGANIKQVALSHSARVVCVLYVIPLVLVYGFGHAPVEETPETVITWSLQEGLLLLGCGIAGMYLAKWVRIPANKIIGPLVLSGALHLSGVITSAPPDFLSLGAQLVLGTAIGTRFVNTSVREITTILASAISMALFMLLISALCAWAVAEGTGLSFEAMLLAFAPGGFAQMALAALSLGVDPALVTTHHAVRLFVILFIGPFVIGWLLKREKGKTEE